METVILVIPNKINRQEKSNSNKYIVGVIFWLIVGIIIYKLWKNKSNKKLKK